ncbi:MAG: hypothetical protein ACLVES_07950 [Faecalibacterium prausnitzii]
MTAYSRGRGERPWPSAWLRSWMLPTTPATPSEEARGYHKMAEANKAFAHFRY